MRVTERRIRRLARSRVLLAIVALTLGCSPSSERTALSDRPTLQTLSLPDISGAAGSAQQQIRAQFASLQAAIDRDGTPVGELAAAYGEMGKLFVAAQYYDAAEVCFTNARALAPAEMRWPYLLGHVFRGRNDPARALESFAQARRLAPDHVPTLVWLAEMELAQGRPDAAEPLLARALALDSDSGAALFGLGRVALEKQRYEQAVTYLEGALKVGPTATRIHYPLALAYRALGDRAKAEQHLRLRGEVDLPPADPILEEVAGLLQNAAAYETRAVQAMDERQWAEAVASLEKAVELAPANALTRMNLATSLYMLGEADRALEQYREAIRLSPELARAHFGIGVLMETRGQERAAIDAFTAAVQRDPAFVEARFSLANALRRNGRVEESLIHYAEVLRLNPAVSQASFGYAMGLVRLGRYREALDRLERDTKAFPDQLGFPHALARLLAAAPDDRVRDGKRALMIVRELLEVQRTLGLAETMAMTLAELGLFTEAVGWQREAIDFARQTARADVIGRLEANLRLYENRQPCRTPWANDDPVHRPEPSAQ